MAPISKYAIVQHSGFNTGHEEFEHAVESRHLDRVGDVRLVEKAGGVLFDDYSAAEDFCEAANYPPEVTDLIPQVRGTFSPHAVLGQQIYIPVRDVVVLG